MTWEEIRVSKLAGTGAIRQDMKLSKTRGISMSGVFSAVAKVPKEVANPYLWLMPSNDVRHLNRLIGQPGWPKQSCAGLPNLSSYIDGNPRKIRHRVYLSQRSLKPHVPNPLSENARSISVG